ncbi:MAG: hypothetical protein B0D92_05840 [Spirochaeta sp. LUC14_002_19_P3]|nr:MAG: hypothetical protein B0D92_05840 [Spirochaeta sp. LUC14_002_19_P3]
MNKKVFFLLILIAAAATSLNALESLANVLPALSNADKEKLVRDGELLRFHGEGISPNLLPDTPLSAAAVRELLSGEMTIGIEGLFFTPVEKLPPSYKDMDTDERTLKLYNILRSVSSLTGLEYYSASRGKMRLLFEESWVIDNPDKPSQPLPDPLLDTVPASSSIFIHQKDKSFGTNQSKITFSHNSGIFSALIVNLSPMRYMGIFKVVNPGGMQTHLIIVPVQEGLLVYGTIAAKTLNVKMFLNKAENSFTNRVIALTGWYKTRLLEEFAQ